MLIVAPTWPSYEDIARLLYLEPRYFETRFEEEYRIDPDALARAIDDCRARVIVICNPNNPTGRIVPGPELESVSRIAEERGVVLLLDESFSGVVYDAERWRDSLCAGHDRLVLVGSISKSHHLQGLRIGACMAEDALLDSIVSVHQGMLSSAPSVSQSVAYALLAKHGAPETGSAREMALAAVKERGWACGPSEGTFYLFPRVNEIDAFEAHARTRNVFLLKGGAFGETYRDHFRLCFCKSKDEFGRILDALGPSAGPVPSDRMTVSLPVVSPNTGTTIGHWTPTSGKDVEFALETADRALLRLNSPSERILILKACEAALLSRRERLAEMAVREVGKKREEAAAEIEYAAGFFRAAREALEEQAIDLRPEKGRRVREVPYGTALLIAPFNDPFAGLARKIAPALAAGAPAIAKPSRLGVLCALEFMAALQDAGIRTIVQFIAPERSKAVTDLVADRRIGVVSFTGSTAVGRGIAVRAAEEGKRAILELGGNCPFVILEDADLAQALDDLLERKLRCAGQACSSVNRVFVAEQLFPAFRNALMERVHGLRIGPSDMPGIDLGPVRTRDAVWSLRDLVFEAEGRGERLLNRKPPPPRPESPTLTPLTIVESDGESVF